MRKARDRRNVVRLIGLTALLVANYALPTKAKPTCWECQTCTSGACCVSESLGHSWCVPAGNFCTMSPEDCPE